MNAKEEKKKKEKHKTKEKASYNNKTVIDPITRLVHSSFHSVSNHDNIK